MFESVSVRVVAGALLWSTACILIAVAFHGNLFGMNMLSNDIPYMRSLLRCIVSGAFFGVFFGALVNIPKRPMWLNIGALVFGIAGTQLARLLSSIQIGTGLPSWANGVIMLWLMIVVGSLLGLIPRALTKKGPLKGAQ